jgi:hypothetical protein
VPWSMDRPGIEIAGCGIELLLLLINQTFFTYRIDYE